MNLKELAVLSGFSKSTVSKALNDSSEISVATKEKLKKIAEVHNYMPNKNASALRKKRKDVILVFLPKNALIDYSSLLEGMVEESQNSGYDVQLQLFDVSEAFDVNEVMNYQKNVDGVFLIQPSSTESGRGCIESFIEKELPVVKYIGGKCARRNSKKSKLLGETIGRTLIRNIEYRLLSPASFSKV